MRKDFLPFGQPSIESDEINAVVEVLKSGWIGMGNKCLDFEKNFAEYTGAKFAVSLSSCTAALHLGLLISGVKPGDEAITTPMTFAATANAIIHCGATPVFADIDPLTLNIDPAKIEEKINHKTKAILPVHFAGLPCDMDTINDLASKHNLKVIEDAAHAIGAEYKSKKIGNSKNPVCFSFYANKNITTIEGGMITFDNLDDASLAQVLRVHGLSADAWKRFQKPQFMLSYVSIPGFKYNMSDVQAVLGITQLKKIDRYLSLRESIASKYDKAFNQMEGINLYRRKFAGIQHGLHLYLINLDLGKFKITRNRFIEELRKRNIGATVHYESLHLHPYYQKTFKFTEDSFPNSHNASTSNISLPIYPGMNEEDINDVINAVKEVIGVFSI